MKAGKWWVLGGGCWVVDGRCWEVKRGWKVLGWRGQLDEERVEGMVREGCRVVNG